MTKMGISADRLKEIRAVYDMLPEPATKKQKTSKIFIRVPAGKGKEKDEVEGKGKGKGNEEAQASTSNRVDNEASEVGVTPAPTVIQNGVHEVQTVEPARAGCVEGETGEGTDVGDLFGEDGGVHEVQTAGAECVEGEMGGGTDVGDPFGEDRVASDVNTDHVTTPYLDVGENSGRIGENSGRVGENSGRVGENSGRGGENSGRGGMYGRVSGSPCESKFPQILFVSLTFYQGSDCIAQKHSRRSFCEKWTSVTSSALPPIGSNSDSGI
jgi:hypothetical protein